MHAVVVITMLFPSFIRPCPIFCFVSRVLRLHLTVQGNNVRLEEALLWDSVTVGDDSTVPRSVLCDGVVLKPECTVFPRCVLSFGVSPILRKLFHEPLIFPLL